MAEYVYTTVAGKIPQLLTKIREAGRPTKVTTQWLKTMGFTSSNDSSLLGVLKFIGFTDASGIPTDRWTQYRGANHARVLGDAIRHGYADLFAVYPDANQRTDGDLEHVFSTSSSGGRQVIAKTVSTFKNLAGKAEFSPVSEQTDLHVESGPLHTPPAAAPHAPGGRPQPQASPSLHIDIQVHISSEASADQIDQVFASMAKHLYGRKAGD